MTIKTCSKCGFVGDVDLFVRNENKCKWCEKAYRKAYNKAYYKANSENRKAYMKAYNKAYRKANSENIKAQSKAYRKANSENIKAHYKANSEHIKAYMKAYNKANSENIKERDKVRVDSLLDSYVVKSLNMKKEEVTPELLELKRDQLKIYRLLKEAKNGIT